MQARPRRRCRAPTNSSAEALQGAYPQAVAQWRLSPAVAVCGNPQFGDYQCNNAMALFQRLRSEPGGQPPPSSPRAVAEALLRALPPSPLVESTRRAGRPPSHARARSRLTAPCAASQAQAS